MFVTYKAEGETEQRFEFEPRKVRASEAEDIERHAGQAWDTWLAALQTGSMRARRVLLWHLLRGQHAALRFEDTPDFYAGDLLLEYSLAELEAMRERAEKADLPEEPRRVFLRALADQIRQAQDREGAALGKALSQIGESGTRSS